MRINKLVTILIIFDISYISIRIPFGTHFRFVFTIINCAQFSENLAWLFSAQFLFVFVELTTGARSHRHLYAISISLDLSSRSSVRVITGIINYICPLVSSTPLSSAPSRLRLLRLTRLVPRVYSPFHSPFPSCPIRISNKPRSLFRSTPSHRLVSTGPNESRREKYKIISHIQTSTNSDDVAV